MLLRARDAVVSERDRQAAPVGVKAKRRCSMPATGVVLDESHLAAEAEELV